MARLRIFITEAVAVFSRVHLLYNRFPPLVDIPCIPDRYRREIVGQRLRENGAGGRRTRQRHGGGQHQHGGDGAGQQGEEREVQELPEQLPPGKRGLRDQPVGALILSGQGCYYND